MPGGFFRIVIAFPLLLTLGACGSDSMTTTASRIPASPTPSPIASPTATDAPPRPTATAATDRPPTPPPQPTATPAPPTATPEPAHGQCNFSRPGSFVCTIPAGVTEISITATAGGGGGGDACCNEAGGFTGLGGSPAGSESATRSLPSSGQTLAVTVGSGGPHGPWSGNPATRGGHGEPSLVTDAAGSVLIRATGGTGGLYCSGARRTELGDGKQACGNPPSGEGGLGGGCFKDGTDGCNGTSGAVTISW